MPNTGEIIGSLGDESERIPYYEALEELTRGWEEELELEPFDPEEEVEDDGGSLP